MMRNQKIYPAIWLNTNPEIVLTQYTSLFPNSKMYFSTNNTSFASVGGLNILALGDGTEQMPNPSISFTVYCQKKEEIDRLWKEILDRGKVWIPLKEYSWNAYYGWAEDKNGISWQLMLDDRGTESPNQIVTSLFFCGTQQGNCAKAIDFYTQVFKNADCAEKIAYEDGELVGQTLYALFDLEGVTFTAMDSAVPQEFTFNEAISLVLECENQEEIDYYWDSFTQEGTGANCGWCKDQFGINWQIIPNNLHALLSEDAQVVDKLKKMKKIIISEL